ncbi:Cof-type HAD-IIB family hydrolase [Celerinatantimonas sp. YJH-8]|uniref:Cof-type HAD-IIB family hydrolase n=1 Tax=Celerinatantimonas sp. YJH-8 TaxID=3228714 RepID=UPI0038BE208C
MYQLIASDLDGTLLNRTHQVSPTTIALLNQLSQQQIHILIASGRHYRDVSRIAQDFSFPMYLITSNGARVHTSDGQLLFKKDVPALAVDDILKLTQGCNFYRNLYHDDHWFVEEDNDRILSYTDHSGFTYTRTDFSQVTRDGISKMLFIGDPDGLIDLERILLERYGDHLNITFSLPTCLEIMAGDANKGTALKMVLDKLQISPEHAIAFGDGLNDKEMLELVKEGILMANADQRLQRLLPDNPHTLTNDQDGVAVYLKKVFENTL